MKFCIAMAALASASVAAGAAPEKQAEGPSKPLAQLLESCDAHKFETTVDTKVDGEPHRSKVKLCGKEGQSDADWIGTLKDAIAKLDANKEMDAAVRDQIVTAIKGEIARIQSEAPKQAAAIAADPGFGKEVQSVANDYSTLPPLPTAPPPPPKLLQPTTTTAVAGPPAASAIGTVALPVLRAGPAPKISFACYSPGDLGGDAPCTGFERETLLTVRAAENLPAGVTLRFVRNGDPRASVDLAQLHRGKSLRLALPRDVCEGVGDGRLELQVLQNGAPVKTDGPYSLRC